MKVLYKKARAVDLKNFTGIDSLYEAPTDPYINVNKVELSADAATEMVLSILESREPD